MVKDKTSFSRDDVKSNLDELFSNVENFRNTDSFRQMLDFVSKFKSLSPYNAFLLYQQRPGVEFVLNASAWYKRFKRRIKPNARPLIILVPFGPVDYVYDISDTYPVDDKNQPTLFAETDEEIISSLIEPYKTTGYVPNNEMLKLIESMLFHGIAMDNNLKVGNGYAGQIELSGEFRPKLTLIYKNTRIGITANYLLSIRDKAECGEAFATAIHELGHLFCHHLTAVPSKAWEVRHLDHISEEFEAEAVSFIVCTRYGINSPSVEYLNGYYAKNKTIPQISVENIFTACNIILNMIKGISLKQGILYKYDDDFKKMINDIR